jgi:hypothetical protein
MTRQYAACLLALGLTLAGCGGTSTPDSGWSEPGSPPATVGSAPTPTAVEAAPPTPAMTPRAKTSHYPKPPPRPKPAPRITHRPTHQYAAGVHPGAFCSPAGAYGHTSAGTLMRCKGPGQPRWRRA